MKTQDISTYDSYTFKDNIKKLINNDKNSKTKYFINCRTFNEYNLGNTIEKVH